MVLINYMGLKLAYKHDYDTKLFRRTQIIAKLYNGAKLTHKELSEKFNVCTKTIQRDFNSLVTLYPIYKDGRNWKLQDDYEFEEQLSVEDDLTLKLLLQASKSFDKSFQESSSRLLSRINENISSPIYTKIELENISNKIDIVHLIENAINKSKQISFTYSKDNDKFDLTVNPYKIVNFDSFWYLVALRDKNLRKYYLQNITDVKILDTNYRKSKKIEELITNAINIWFNDENKFEVELLIDKSIVEHFKRKLLSKTQKLKEIDKNGNMIVSIEVTHKNEIIPIVKYWLPNIKILKPTSLNEEIKEEISKFVNWT